MATYHFSIKAGSRGTGASGKAHADYISRDGQYAHKGDLETAWSANVPAWASTGSDFFAAADENERANGTVYREIELALPRELTPDQREKLVDQFCQDTFGDRHVYKVAIHNPQAAIEGGEQPHAHVMFCDRQLDGHERDRETFFKRANSAEPEKGGAKKAEIWSGKDRGQHVEALRENWGKAVNVAYEKANRPERVDHRSLENQGITRAPEPHLGPHLAAGPAGDHLQGVRQDRERVADLDRQIAGIDQIQQVFVVEPVKPTPTPEPEKPVQEAVRPIERPVFEPVKPKPEPLPPVDQVQQIIKHRTPEEIRADIDRIEQRYAVTAEDRAAHKAAYLAPIQSERAKLRPKISDYNAELTKWKELGHERGWTPGKPPLAFGRAEFKAWEAAGAKLEERAQALKVEKDGLDKRLEAAERNYSHAPQWDRHGGEECDLWKLPAQKAQAQSPEYRELKAEWEASVKHKIAEEIAREKEKAPEKSRGREIEHDGPGM